MNSNAINNPHMTKTTATASYRMPRERDGQPSRVLRLTWDGETARMSGGKWGAHEIMALDNATVSAHWAGYVSNNMGRAVRPSIQWERVR